MQGTGNREQGAAGNSTPGKVTITRAQLVELEGLAAVGKGHVAKADQCMVELTQIFGTDAMDFAGELIFKGQSVAWFMDRMGLEVEG